MTVTSAGSSSTLASLRQLQQTTFKTADADGAGQLSLSEFQSIGQNVQGGSEHRGPPPMRAGCGPSGHFSGDTLSALLSTQSVDDVAKSVMEAGDADGDGKLTTSEISSALTAKAPEETDGQDDMASKIMAALDTDGDGSLSTSEISTAISNAASHHAEARAAHGRHHGAPPAGAETASGTGGVFESLDKNQDGVVSAEELAGANGGDSADGATAASDMVKAADQDGDGSLSGAEFQAMLDQGKATGTDAATNLTSLISGSTAAADLMQKLLAQLDSALTSSSSSSTNGSVSSGAGVTA